MDWRKLVGLLGPRAYRQSTDLGPDFPASAGDRERSRFRESVYPRLTTVAVVNDDGSPINTLLGTQLDELIREVKLLRSSLVATGVAVQLDDPL